MKEIMLAGLIGLTCLLSVSNAYVDLQNNHWAKQYIEEMVKKEIMLGYPDGSFRADENMTIAEFITTLIKSMEIIPEEHDKSHWADDYIKEAENLKIINLKTYVDDNKKNAPVTRYEIMDMFIRTSPNSNNICNEDIELTSTFDDIKKESKKNINMSEILRISEIMSGYPDNTIRMSNYATRAEVCTLISKFIKNRNKLENINLNKNIENFYGNSRYITFDMLPFKLCKWKDCKKDDALVDMNIEKIRIFKFDEGDKSEYKEIFDSINESNIPYFVYRKKFGENAYVIAMEVSTQNNHASYTTTSGYDYIKITFPEEDIQILDIFDTDEVEMEKNGEAYTGNFVKPAENHKITIFFIVNKIPEEKIKLSRSITTMYDEESKENKNISANYSLVIGI